MWTRGSRQPVWVPFGRHEGGSRLFCASALGIWDVLEGIWDTAAVEALRIGRGGEERRDRIGEAALSGSQQAAGKSFKMFSLKLSLVDNCDF